MGVIADNGIKHFKERLVKGPMPAAGVTAGAKRSSTILEPSNLRPDLAYMLCGLQHNVRTSMSLSGSARGTRSAGHRQRAHVRDRVEVGGVRIRATGNLLPRADNCVVQLPQPREILVVHDFCTACHRSDWATPDMFYGCWAPF